jgi:KDO2-lipid IV(A) lauroyltransferase
VQHTHRPRSLVSRLTEAVMVGVVRGVFALSRALGPERSGAVGAALTRTFGPWLRAHRTALANIRAAYPEKSEAEVKALALAAWDNLGRVGGEYPHLGNLFDFDPDSPVPGRTEVDGIDHFLSLRDDGRPGLIFSAHLANWELPAICAARFGLDTTAVFRAPNDPAIDQHFTRGVLVNFMGRPALVNPILGKFARRFDCPVHGVRVIRLPGHRFRLQLTPPLDLPRDPDGQINVQGAMQAMTSVVEEWVREYPEQWLWMHRRWRAPAKASDPKVESTF